MSDGRVFCAMAEKTRVDYTPSQLHHTARPRRYVIDSFIDPAGIFTPSVPSQDMFRT